MVRCGFILLLSLGWDWYVVPNFREELLDYVREIRLRYKLRFDIRRRGSSVDLDGRHHPGSQFLREEFLRWSKMPFDVLVTQPAEKVSCCPDLLEA